MALPLDSLIDLIRSVHSESPGTDFLRTDSSGGGGGGGGVVTPAGFGTLSPGYPTQISVGTTSVELLPTNANRLYAHIVNNTQFEIFIQYSSAAALNQGIKLQPGNFYTIDSSNLYKGVVNAIGTVDAQFIDVLEGIA